MPQLSIIVTSYNIASFISACLDTVIAQTISDIEIIVVDDGSSDGSADIVRSYAARDPRIRLILFDKNTPGGVATAANAGLAIATGEFIGFMDGDDLCEPTMFAKLVEAARRHDADLAMCRYLQQLEPGGERTEPAEQRRWLDYPSETFVPLNPASRRAMLRFISVPWRKIYRRTLLERHAIRFPEGDFFYEDNPFHWFCITSAEGIVLVPEVLCYHRIGRPGQTMASTDERLFRIFQHFFIIRDWLSARGELGLYRLDLLGWALSQLEWIGRRTPPELHQRLFETTVPVLTDYSQGEVDAVISDFGKGKSASDLAHALRKRNAAAFSAALKATGNVQADGPRPKRASLMREGLHHLRTYGIVSTTRTTSRFLMREARDRVGKLGLTAGLRRSATDKVSNSDILFALVVLERQIDNISKHRTADGITNEDLMVTLQALRHRLAAIEASLKPNRRRATKVSDSEEPTEDSAVLERALRRYSKNQSRNP
jgi:glycosyltransferase involved in cell wall biosynthesis